MLPTPRPDYLLTPGQPEPQDLPKLPEVGFELRLQQVPRQVSDVDHSWGQAAALWWETESIDT